MKLIILIVFSIISLFMIPDKREYESIPKDFDTLVQTQDTTLLAYWKSRARKAELLAEENACDAELSARIAQSNSELAMRQGDIAQ